MTRDTVDFETPAAAATASSVGAGLRPFGAGSLIWVAFGSVIGSTESAGVNDPTVLDSAALRRVLQGVVVDPHEPETLVVPPRPLEVVHEGPVEVPLLGHAPV